MEGIKASTFATEDYKWRFLGAIGRMDFLNSLLDINRTACLNSPFLIDREIWRVDLTLVCQFPHRFEP